jgi:polyvinyl alcohol dehydrogenase (cytochrome)
MKKLIITILIIGITVAVIGTDRLPVKQWLMTNGETLVIEYADVLPLDFIGEKLFDKNCAQCHDNPAMKAPTRDALSRYSIESIMIALEFGKMQPMATHLSKQERGLISKYLAGKDTQSYQWLETQSCNNTAAAGSTEWVTNWGLGIENKRYVNDANTQINASNVGSLSLQWSLAFPKVTDMRSQPVIVGDTMYIGDKAGKLYALDRKTGCIRNHTNILSGIRSSITLAKLSNGKQLLVFANSLATVFAVDPESLKIIWQQPVKISDYSVITGSISYFDGKLFVPISSFEVAASGSSTHECCTSHGAVVSLDINNGDKRWIWHATEDATLQGKNINGAIVYGPSGAPVWTTPAIDEKRNRIYFGTGENLTHPATDTSDTIVALDIDSGEEVWKFQAMTGDVWNAACLNDGPNCPENPGGDFDFGASVIITQNSLGEDILLAGQKSGEVFALNPDTKNIKGEVLWRNRISQGTTNGGIHWGMTVADNTVFVPVSDPERERDGYTPKPGLYALNIDTGEVLWEQPVERGCKFDYSNMPLIGLENARAPKQANPEKQYECSYHYGLSAAATSTSQLVFAAGLDGKIRAYDNDNGEILWQTNTAVAHQTINGIEGHGGAIDVAGQSIAGEWLYVLSGYSMFGQLPGNVLLAYKIDQ